MLPRLGGICIIPINNDKVEQYTTIERLIDKEGQSLAKIVGKEIKDIWVVWELNDNKWYSDCPVVIEVDNQLLLINNYETCSIDIGWNALVIDSKVHEIDFGYKFALQWTNQYEVLKKFIGAKIEDIYFEEYHLVQTVLMNKTNPELVGGKIDNWILSGIGIMTEKGYLSIFNGLDENAFDFEINKKNEEYRYTRLPKV